MTRAGKNRPTPLHELLGWDAPAGDAGTGGQQPDAATAASPSEPAPTTQSAPGGAPDARGTSPTAAHTRPRPRVRPREESRIAIIDGSNVAHAGEGHAARLANVLLMRDKLAAEGFEPIIVVDAALRHQIDDAERYERLVDEGQVKQAPAGTDADYFILAFAKELGATIVSNDTFRDRSRQFAGVRQRVIRYMIVAGEVVLERRTSKRE